MQMTDIVNRRRMRHAHMVNITHADHVRRHARRLPRGRSPQRARDRASSRRAKTIRATTPAGSEHHGARSDPSLRWIKTSGLISPEKWGNLPGGEVFTTPGEVNGTFVIDGVVGDWLCERYGSLKRRAAHDYRREATASSTRGRTNRALRDDFWQYTHTDENSDRVGEFAIGTNIGLKPVIGHILQDEKFPGVHIAFGNPYGAHTGAAWYSSTHIDVVGTQLRHLGGRRSRS